MKTRYHIIAAIVTGTSGYLLKTLYLFFSLILLWGFSACEAVTEEPSRQQDYSNCRYEKPEAIFYDGLPQISDHQFQEQNNGGTEESFVLSGMVGINIVQYGCNYRTQEFKFDLGSGAKCEQPDDCTREVVQIMQALSRLGPEYHVFRVWAKAIREVAPQIRLGRATELTEGFYVKVDHNRSYGHTTLKLTLSEKA